MSNATTTAKIHVPAATRLKMVIAELMQLGNPKATMADAVDHLLDAHDKKKARQLQPGRARLSTPPIRRKST